MSNKKIVIIGGGTVAHVRNHLAICAPAYGHTARRLAELAPKYLPNMDVELYLTKMAGGKISKPGVFFDSAPETNQDIADICDLLTQDDTTKIIILSAALCDWTGSVADWPNNDGAIYETKSGKYENRLKTSAGKHTIYLTPADKIIGSIRENRKDIFLVGFKTTCGATKDEQYLAGLNLCKTASCNLVLANDTQTRLNMIVTPEEARYHVTPDREEVLRGLLEMAAARSHLTFTRSTVIGGNPIMWDSELIPDALRTIVNYCIQNNAYKPFNGVTAGHFACKVDDQTFLTSIRRTNFNDLHKNGLVKIVTDGPDTVLAYGAKPSVGGQSQRIVFHDHPDVDCILHFHCPIKSTSKVPTVSQREFECGSHECGQNTSRGLQKFGNLYAVYLDNHGPNIVFNRNIDPNEVVKFIEDNFDLEQKTGGFVSMEDSLNTSNTFNAFQKILK